MTTSEILQVVLTSIQLIITCGLVILGFHFSKSLQRSEIKFSKYHNLQVEALRNLYIHLVLFRTINRSLFKIEVKHHEDINYLEILDKWLDVYSVVKNLFSKERILLPKELKESALQKMHAFNEIHRKLSKVKHDLYYFRQQCGETGRYKYMDGQFHQLTTMFQELEQMKLGIISENNIKNLRDEFEAFFEKMNS